MVYIKITAYDDGRPPSFNSRRNEENMKCHECGSGMIEKTIDETLELDGQSLTLHDMHGHFCDSCGEGVWNEKSYHRYSEGQEALIRSVRGMLGQISDGSEKN